MATNTRTNSRFKIPPIVWIVLAIGLVFGIPKLIPLIMPKETDPRFSEGNNLHILGTSNEYKRQGIEAYSKKDFKSAQQHFQSSLHQQRNDPESLIYLNNSRAKDNQRFLQLAVVVPIGSNSNIAQEILRGVAQAQNEINNKGGINGQFLHITIVNDNNDPEIAQEVAHKLVDNSDIMAVIGHNASTVSQAVAPIYQESGLVMITPTSSAEGIPDVGNYIFRTLPNTNLMAETLANYALKNGKKSAICYDSNSLASRSFKETFSTVFMQNKGRLSTSVCDLSAPNFDGDQEISEAVNNGADTMLVIPHIDRLEQAHILAESNQGKLKLLGDITLNTMKTLQAGESMKGLSIVVPWSAKNPATQTFATSARQVWGGDVNWRTASAYDATNTLIEGLRQGETRETLQKALERSQFRAKTINGEVKFLPNGDRSGKGIILEVKPSQKHETGYNFMPLK
ncbi:ABC transporter substrate-binding protein [Crocosphaera sp. Alani8]|uniref:ABC transporter substrate-binding protein n=1 Tax=Crocosphaera sp. Alani8 TaxID=3038952 RepID=UPI00313B2B59